MASHVAAPATTPCLVRPTGVTGEQPRQGLLLRWERDRARGRWLALVITADEGELRVEVVAAEGVAPVESDPNRALSRDAAVVRGLRRGPGAR